MPEPPIEADSFHTNITQTHAASDQTTSQEAFSGTTTLNELVGESLYSFYSLTGENLIS